MVGAEPREMRLPDGRILAYNQYGTPDGRPIVFCHGAPSSRVEGNLLIDAALMNELGAQVIIPDRPGIGRSDPKHDRSVLSWADDVRALVDGLNLDTFAVIGSSGGSPF